jgi:uncharacterized protein YqgC (DUF456 family)
MQPAQQPESPPNKSGHWGIVGAALGAFIGLLVGKFTIGLIFGFLVGIVIGSVKNKSSASGSERPSDDGTKD